MSSALIDAVVTTQVRSLSLSLVGILVLSQVPANARLGALLMASVLGCFVAACWFVPALVAGSRPSPRAIP